MLVSKYQKQLFGETYNFVSIILDSAKYTNSKDHKIVLNFYLILVTDHNGGKKTFLIIFSFSNK